TPSSRFWKPDILCDEGKGLSQLFMNQQPLDDLASDDVPFEDLTGIGLGSDAVPHTLGIDHHRRRELAVAEAAGRIGPHSPLEAATLHLLFEKLADLFRTARHATAPGVFRTSSVGADEDVKKRLRHSSRAYRSAIRFHVL